MSTSLQKTLKKDFPLISNDTIFRRTFNIGYIKSQKLKNIKNINNTVSLTSLSTESNTKSNLGSHLFSLFNSRNKFYDYKKNFLPHQDKDLSKKSTLLNITDMNQHVLFTNYDSREKSLKNILRKKSNLNTHYTSNTTSRDTKTESFSPLTTDINLVDFDRIMKYSYLITKKNSPIKNEKTKTFPKTPFINGVKKGRNYKSSLNYLLGKNLIFDENSIDKKYKPNLYDFLGEKENIDFSNKNKKLVKSKGEIIKLYKNIKLMKSTFDYLNCTLSRLYNEKRSKEKELKKEEKKLKMSNIYETDVNSKLKKEIIPIDKLCKVRKYFSQKKEKKTKEKRVKILYKNGFLSKSILKPEYALNLKKNLFTSCQRAMNIFE